MLCDELYNELCQLLTNFETGERPVDANDFYSLLVKIQNNWNSWSIANNTIKKP